MKTTLYLVIALLVGTGAAAQVSISPVGTTIATSGCVHLPINESMTTTSLFGGPRIFLYFDRATFPESYDSVILKLFIIQDHVGYCHVVAYCPENAGDIQFDMELDRPYSYQGRLESDEVGLIDIDATEMVRSLDNDCSNLIAIKLYTPLCAAYGVFTFGSPFNPNIAERPRLVFMPAVELTIADVLNDEGGVLHASWSRHWSDSSSAQHPITNYDVQKFEGTWTTIALVAATEAEEYGTDFSTTDIYTVGEPEPLAAYRVVARTADPGVYFISESDSAYSVDNLPPPQPVAQLLEFPGIVVIMWETPDIPDFNEACIYRGTTPGFIPGEPLVCTDTPGVVDQLPVMFYYRVQFSDVHGNLSEFSELLSPTTTAVNEGQVPPTLALMPPYPNPFNPRTTLSFTLPSAGYVTLAVYDARGSEVMRLVDETLPAGAHSVDWTGVDAAGHSVPSGTYFCRLTTSWGVEKRKLQLVR